MRVTPSLKAKNNKVNGIRKRDMPIKPPHPCNHPGCPSLTHSRFCLVHAKQEQQRSDNLRPSSNQRGYDLIWSQFRKMYLSAHPFCIPCQHEGHTTLATIVHHIKPLEHGGARLDESNVMSCCDDCHREMHGYGSKSYTPDIERAVKDMAGVEMR